MKIPPRFWQYVSGVILIVVLAAFIMLWQDTPSLVQTAQSNEIGSSPTPLPMGTIEEHQSVPPTPTFLPPTFYPTLPPEEGVDTPEPLSFPTSIPTQEVTPIPLASPPFVEQVQAPEISVQLLLHEGDMIRTANLDGTNLQDVVNVHAVTGLHIPNNQPVWASVAPSGKQVVLVLESSTSEDESSRFEAKTYHLYLMDVESARIESLNVQGAEPAWSPDGSKIAYSSNGLWVMDITSKDVWPLYLFDEESATDPKYATSIDWSYDGKYIAFIEGTGWTAYTLTVVSSDPASPDVVFTERNSGKRTGDEEFWMTGARWSPVSHQLIYLQESWSTSYPDRTIKVLWHVDLDAMQPERLLDTDLLVQFATWSPSGRWIAALGQAPHEQENIGSDIWLINTETRELNRLTSYRNSGNTVLVTFWSADERYLYYVVDDTTVWQLDLQDGKQVQVPVTADRVMLLQPRAAN